METESERESAAVASMAAEPMRRPRVRLKKNIHSFTRMERKRMTTAIQEKVVTSGEKIFSREDLPISTPIRRMARATTRPVRYSIRPWPKGCSWSASCPASRNPTKVMTEEAASDRLLKASATTAMEPVARPERSLPRKSRALSAMPTPPDTEPHR